MTEELKLKIELRDRPKAELVTRLTVSLVQKTYQGDFGICAAAWVEPSIQDALSRAMRQDGLPGDGPLNDEQRAKVEEAKRKLLGHLIKHRHGTPFEHNALTFYVDAPIFVWREFHRHRIGFSYNEVSGRYKKLEARFWSCPDNRPLVAAEGSTGMKPSYLPAPTLAASVALEQAKCYEDCYAAYERMLSNGVAKEVARSVLPVATMSQCWVTCNARSLMHFLSLRVHDPLAKFVSYPQEEIQQVARLMEAEFAKQYPITHALFVENGRVAP